MIENVIEMKDNERVETMPIYLSKRMCKLSFQENNIT